MGASFLYSFVQALAISLTAASALALASASFRTTPTQLAELSRATWGYSVAVLKSLAGDVGRTRAGTLLLMLGLVAQSFPIAHPPHMDVERDWRGIAAGVLVAALIGWLAICWGDREASKLESVARKILEAPKDQH